MITLTKGIVLRKIKYGDSSQIIHIFTQDYGLQSCIIKGLKSGGKSNRKANLLYPASLIELNLYYREDKQIKFINEVHPALFYQNIGIDVTKNSVAVFAMEVLHNLLLPDAVQPELFQFCETFLTQLDHYPDKELANFPLFFLVYAGRLLGYHILGNFCEKTPFLNLREGAFVAYANHQDIPINAASIAYMSQVNNAPTLAAIQKIKMSHTMRQCVLQQFLQFFEMHLPHFRPLKSVGVLSAIFS